METLRQDLRYVIRMLWKNPGFTIATVLVLALGLGANTAIFSVANSVVLRPLDYAEPDRLVRIYETYPRAGGVAMGGSVSIPNFEDWRTQARSFEAMAIAGYTESMTLQGRGDAERLSAVPVGSDLFPLLGVQPMVGRYFAPGEDEPGAAPVVVLSEQAWQTRFGADPEILGTMLTLNGEAHTVVGIMPADFRFPAGAEPRDLWVPLRPSQDWATRGMHAYIVLGRLAPGVTAEAAQAEMARIAAGLAQEYPNEQEGRSASVRSLHETVVGRVQPMLLVLLGAAGLVLLISCANAASLLLARATARRREVAIRTALGATRGRVVRQFLAESLTLAAMGAALGLALAWVSLRAISVAAGPLLPRASEIGIDPRVVAFLVVIAAITGAVFGLIPALQTARVDVQAHLREGGRQNSGGRSAQAFRGTLVVTQIALSLVLLIGAGLLMRTFVALLGTETGMATEQVLTMKLGDPGDRYESNETAIHSFYTPMLERVRSLPGVGEAGMINLLPLEESGNSGGFEIVGSRYASEGESPYAEIRVASPGYFAAMGIPMLRGRDFAAQDDLDAAPVALVNQALAERYFPGEDPVGRQIQRGDERITILGVVGSVRQVRLDSEPLPELYIPNAQLSSTREMSLVLSTGTEPMALAQAVRGVIREAAPQQVVYAVRPMQQVVSESFSDRRLVLWLLGAFSAVAMTLAVTGIYGVIAYSVAQRTREFGIRLALGSGQDRVSRMVVSQGVRLAGLGIAIGLPAAYLLTRLLASLLYGVGTADPLTFASVTVLLAVVALLASYLPARRATRVDPMIALRAE
jgi:putative ABC transport system permease protein